MIWSLGHNKTARFAIKKSVGKLSEIVYLDTLASLKDALKRGTPDCLISEASVKDGSISEFGFFKFPVLILSVDRRIETIRKLLSGGASDYLLLKPFCAELFRAKIEYLLRCSGENRLKTATSLHLDAGSHLLERGSQSVELTKKEIRIMLVLMKAAEAGVTREEILKEAWKGIAVVSKAFDVHLFNLRKKVRALGVEIRYAPPDRYVLKIGGDSDCA